MSEILSVPVIASGSETRVGRSNWFKVFSVQGSFKYPLADRRAHVQLALRIPVPVVGTSSRRIEALLGEVCTSYTPSTLLLSLDPIPLNGDPRIEYKTGSRYDFIIDVNSLASDMDFNALGMADLTIEGTTSLGELGCIPVLTLTCVNWETKDFTHLETLHTYLKSKLPLTLYGTLLKSGQGWSIG